MIQSDRLLQTFLTILGIDSFHPQEDAVIDALRPKLDRVGVQLTVDPHRNVLGYWPGKGVGQSAESVLLCAHTDTVRPTAAMEPIVRDGAVHSDGSSVLGADDKAAVAAIVEALEAVADTGVDHPPVKVLFTVGEDVGHIGSKAFDISSVRSPFAIVPDVDGPVGEIVLAAPWSQNHRVTFIGRAAHAGTEPEAGRSAICMAARAIDRMRLGRIDEETTANVGLIAGGEAPNIIPPRSEILIQVRSLDQQKQRKYVEELLQHCRCAAGELDGRMESECVLEYSGFRLAESEPAVRRAVAAIRQAGLDPKLTATCGGSDANELNAKGLPTVVISVGYQDIHSNMESMPLGQLNRLAEVCVSLMLGSST